MPLRHWLCRSFMQSIAQHSLYVKKKPVIYTHNARSSEWTNIPHLIIYYYYDNAALAQLTLADKEPRLSHFSVLSNDAMTTEKDTLGRRLGHRQKNQWNRILLFRCRCVTASAEPRVFRIYFTSSLTNADPPVAVPSSVLCEEARNSDVCWRDLFPSYFLLSRCFRFTICTSMVSLSFDLFIFVVVARSVNLTLD